MFRHRRIDAKGGRIGCGTGRNDQAEVPIGGKPRGLEPVRQRARADSVVDAVSVRRQRTFLRGENAG
jgi:hypothetical protein